MSRNNEFNLLVEKSCSNMKGWGCKENRVLEAKMWRTLVGGVVEVTSLEVMSSERRSRPGFSSLAKEEIRKEADQDGLWRGKKTRERKVSVTEKERSDKAQHPSGCRHGNPASVGLTADHGPPSEGPVQ